MTTEVRKRLFVHNAIQGSLLVRFAIHWALFATLSCMLLIALQTFFAVSQSPEVRYQQARLTLVAFAVVSLVLIPAFSLDLIRLSNRFVGPIVRLQKYFQTIDPIEVKPLQVRKNDYWRDLVEDVNTAVDRLRANAGPSDYQSDPSSYVGVSSVTGDAQVVEKV